MTTGLHGPHHPDVIVQDGEGSLVRYARIGFIGVAWLFVACLFVQLFLVGLDLFEAGIAHSVHADFAYAYGWLLPGMLLLGRIGRLSGRTLALTAMLLILYAAQTLLPSIADAAPLLAAFHAVNAIVIFWLATSLAHRAGRSAAGNRG